MSLRSGAAKYGGKNIMNYVEQKLFFNELKYEAVSKVLDDLDSTVEEQLHKTFEDLYKKWYTETNTYMETEL